MNDHHSPWSFVRSTAPFNVSPSDVILHVLIYITGDNFTLPLSSLSPLSLSVGRLSKFFLLSLPTCAMYYIGCLSLSGCNIVLLQCFPSGTICCKEWAFGPSGPFSHCAAKGLFGCGPISVEWSPCWAAFLADGRPSKFYISLKSFFFGRDWAKSPEWMNEWLLSIIHLCSEQTDLDSWTATEWMHRGHSQCRGISSLNVASCRTIRKNFCINQQIVM